MKCEGEAAGVLACVLAAADGRQAVTSSYASLEQITVQRGGRVRGTMEPQEAGRKEGNDNMIARTRSRVKWHWFISVM